MSADGSSRPKVLLADDSRIVRVTARKLIGDETELVLAESGEAAWAAITTDPDILVVFSDVCMPGLDGYGLLERIRGDERELVNQLPVIMVTGQDEAGAREEALERGATDFINKPFDRTVLLARTRSYATQDQIRRRAAALESSQTQDAATGLGNARYFEKRLRSAHAHSLRHGRYLSLIHIDCLADRSYLRQAGQRLAHRLREEDVLVHLGGGRFAAICPDCDAEGSCPLAERLLAALRRPEADGESTLPAAVGVYVVPVDRDIPLQESYDQARQIVDAARAQGDGALVIGPEARQATDDDPVPTLDEAIAMLAEPDGARRLERHMPELLESCARLFEAAPAEVAEPILDRIRRQHDGAAAAGATAR